MPEMLVCMACGEIIEASKAPGYKCDTTEQSLCPIATLTVPEESSSRTSSEDPPAT